MNLQTIRMDIRDYGEKLFFDSAGASLMPVSVLEVMENYQRREASEGGYRAADLSVSDIAAFYDRTATLVNAEPHHIAFMHDATDAYSKALSSIPFKNGDTIITTDDDYASNHIQFLSLSRRCGLRISRIRNLENGDLDISHFEELLTKYRPALVAITHVPTNSGLVQDVEAIGAICRQQQLLYLVDACQSVGQLPVDVQKIQCDFLSATGRKFLRGPRGTGFLYVSDRVLEEKYTPLLPDGRGAVWTKEKEFEVADTATRFETWETPYALLLGLCEALRYLEVMGIDRIQKQNGDLMGRLRNNLDATADIRLLDKGSTKCNILTFRKEGRTLDQIMEVFNVHRVYYSVSRKPWGLIDFGKKGIDWAIRLSPHYFNTHEEIDQLSDIISNL